VPDKLLTEPVTFAEAVAELTAKQDKPTALKTKEIAALWDAQTKRAAFFSARVANADILSKLHRWVAQVANGEMTEGQGRELARTFLAGDGSGALAALGFAPPDAESGMAELGSTRRLSLIINQNVKMAQETAAYQSWQEQADYAPFGVWRLGVSAEHRPQHVAHADKVYPAAHPIWTTDPPGGLFNCHCYREELTAAQAKGMKIESNDTPLEPSPLGFDPSKPIGSEPPPDKPDWTPEIRDELQKALAKVDKLHPPPP